MTYIIPDCFKNFKCTASACSDNCCIGWEIDVDEESYKFYKSLDDDFGKKIIANIETGEVRCFRLGENERCPFLNEENLCQIITRLGEDKIPEICRNHPRFFNWLYDRTEMGIGLCCEEGARMLFSSKDKLKVDVDYTLTDDLSDVLTYTRGKSLDIIQDRSLSLFERLIRFLGCSQEVDERLMAEDVQGMVAVAESFANMQEAVRVEPADDLKNLIKIFSDLEPINDEWTKYIKTVCKKSEEIGKKRTEFFKQHRDRIYEYEHFTVYLICRYYMKALEDFDLLSRANFIVLCVLFLMVMDINSYINHEKDYRITNCVLFSKEVEYSEENINAICEASYEKTEDIYGLIKSFEAL